MIKYFRLGIAFFLVIFLLTSIGFNDLSVVIKRISLLPLFGVILCAFTIIVVGALNMWLLLNTLTPVSFTNLLKIYSYSWAMSLITPGQAGDATIILLMKKHGIPFSLTGSAYFIDKVITLCLFLTISLYGCLYLIPGIKINYVSLFKSIVVLVFIAAVVFFILTIKLKLLERLKRFISNVQQNLAVFKNNYHIALFNFVLTVIKWILVSWSFRLAFLSFGATIKWPDIGVIPIMSTLVGYIPISIGGIGTVELSATYLFGLKEVAANVVVTSYILMRLINYLSALGIITLMNPFKSGDHG